MNKRKPNYQQNRRKKPTASSAPILYGQHAVRAALANPKRQLVRLHATKNAARDLEAELANLSVPVNLVDQDKLTAMVPADAVHQGLVLETQMLTPLTLDALIAGGELLIILDQVSDPRNVGAIFWEKQSQIKVFKI